MDHARPRSADVRNVLLTQPHRVRLARRALLRVPLLREGWRRREREREAQKRGGGHDRPETRLSATNIHYRPTLGCFAPVSTVNSVTVASSVANCAWRSCGRTWATAGNRLLCTRCGRYASARLGRVPAPPLRGCNPVAVADSRQLLGREQRDHAAHAPFSVTTNSPSTRAPAGLAIHPWTIGSRARTPFSLIPGRMIERNPRERWSAARAARGQAHAQIQLPSALDELRLSRALGARRSRLQTPHRRDARLFERARSPVEPLARLLVGVCTGVARPTLKVR